MMGGARGPHCELRYATHLHQAKHIPLLKTHSLWVQGSVHMGQLIYQNMLGIIFINSAHTAKHVKQVHTQTMETYFTNYIFVRTLLNSESTLSWNRVKLKQRFH